jgi:hypothetical protein
MYTTLKVSNNKLRYFLIGKIMYMNDDRLIKIANDLYLDYKFSIDNYGPDDHKIERL